MFFTVLRSRITHSFFTLTFLGFLFTSFSTNTEQPQTPLFDELGNVQLSDQDMQLLQELNSQLEDLSPEQRDQLEKEFSEIFEEVAREVEQKLEAMPEEKRKAIEAGDQKALEAFLADFFEEPAKEPSEPTLAPKEEKKAEVEKPKEPVKPTNVQKEAIDMLEDIIKQSNDFVIKMSRIEDIDARIERWKREKKLKTWTAEDTWHKVKSSIELLTQKLHVLQTQDPVTHAYKHIDGLIANQELYKQLADLRSKLNMYIPNIKIKIDLSKETTSAIRALLDAYVPLFNQEIIKKLDSLTEPYEKRAKELREKEELALKKAKEEAKRPRPVTPPVIAGVKPEPIGVPLFEPTPVVSRPITPVAPTAEVPSVEPVKPTVTPVTPKPTPADKIGEEKVDKEDEKKPKVAEVEKKPTEAPKEVVDIVQQLPPATRRVTEGEFYNIEKSLTEIAKKLKNNKFDRFLLHLADDKEDVDEKLVEAMPTIINEINTLIQQIHEFKERAKKLGGPIVAAYNAKLNALYAEKQKEFDFNLFMRHITEIKTDIKSKTGYYQQHATIGKRIYYLGDINLVQTLAQQEPALKELVESKRKEQQQLTKEEITEQMEKIIEKKQGEKRPDIAITLEEEKDEPTKKVDEERPVTTIFDLQKALEELKKAIETFAR